MYAVGARCYGRRYRREAIVARARGQLDAKNEITRRAGLVYYDTPKSDGGGGVGEYDTIVNNNRERRVAHVRVIMLSRPYA